MEIARSETNPTSEKRSEMNLYFNKSDVNDVFITAINRQFISPFLGLFYEEMLNHFMSYHIF